MYGVVLATMLTASSATPDWGCHGCYGYNAFSCHGCHGYNAFSCHGCYGCWGCHGCYGCWGCHGCYGGVVIYHVAPAPPHRPGGQPPADPRDQQLQQMRKRIQELEEMIKKMKPPPKEEENGVSAADPDKARVTVRLPAEAMLTIDGVTCPLTSSTRTFETPRLPSGQRFYYTLRAEVVRDGRTHAEDRRVIVEAGKHVTVEFGELTTVRLSPR